MGYIGYTSSRPATSHLDFMKGSRLELGMRAEHGPRPDLSHMGKHEPTWAQLGPKLGPIWTAWVQPGAAWEGNCRLS